MIHLLKPAHKFLAFQMPATEQKHRDVRVEGGRHPGDRVGYPRTGSDEGHAESTGQTTVSLRTVGGRLFVADIDDPDALLHTTVKDGNNVPARQGEDGINSFCTERPGNDLTAVDLGHAGYRITSSGCVRIRGLILTRASAAAIKPRAASLSGAATDTGWALSAPSRIAERSGI